VTVNSGPPSGHEVLERYLVLPSARRPRFLISEASGFGAGEALASYNALRPVGTRLARSILAGGLRRGMAQRVFRDRLTVSVSGEVPSPVHSEPILSEYLRQLLGQEGRPLLAIGLRDRGPNTKPVVQVFSPKGEPWGYVKVGWNEFTRGLIDTEARFLEATPAFSKLEVPMLIGAGRWRNLEISAIAPLPERVRRFAPAARLPPAATTWDIAQIGGMQEAPLSSSSYWHRLRLALSNLLEGASARSVDAVQGCLNRLEDRYGDTSLVFGGWHGDWVPWNLAWDGNSLVVWDWEHTGRGVPLGFDVVHYLFQVPFAKRKRKLAVSIGEMRRRGPPELDRLGVPPDTQPALISAYLLQLFARYQSAQRAGAGVNTRFFPYILEVLEREPPP
jgi:hypothetical protein